MHRNFIATALLVSILGTTSCASIIDGRQQTLGVNTSNPGKGECVLRDAKGMTYNVNTPGAVIVNRGDGPIDVNCTLENAHGTGIVGEKVNPWIIGNVIFGLGGIIGVGIDAVTGAYQRYPEAVTIPVSASMPSADPATNQPLDFKQSEPVR